MSFTKRLLDQFVPEHYAIEITPDIDALTFQAQTRINGKLPKDSDTILLHGIDLKIKSVTVSTGSESYQPEVAYHPESQIIELTMNSLIKANEAVLIEAEYSGTITETMEGIYPSFYDQGGAKKTLISTQFESHHARAAFPSIDEPAAKATFDLSLEVPKELTVLANTPVKAEQIEAANKRVSFETTPRMSTYLLAFVIGELIEKQAISKHDITTRVYAVPGNEQRLDYALDVAVKCLDYYSDYFGIEYPLEKCDMVAIPEFAVGAMENWGLITYRETALLIDEQESSLATKKRVTEVVAHELAHQWFGNLVTMQWWDDLWLNESFATFMSNLAMDHLHPEWDIWADFYAEETELALAADAQLATRPIIAAVEDPRDISEFFEPAITYAKGACVLRMLHNYIGAAIFEDGISTYLKRHAYANATHDDLWKALETVSDKPVRLFMEAWTKKPGFPLVHVASQKDGLELSQSRFLLTPDDKPTSETIWPIPVRLAGEENQFLLEKASQIWELPSQPAILKINPDQTGFYRVNYSANELIDLSEPIAAGSLSVIDRMAVLGDAMEAAKAGQADIEPILRLMTSYPKEEHPAVWNSVAGALGDLWRVMDNDKFRAAMEPVGRELVSIQLARLGWDKQDNESHFDTLLRPVILGLASRYKEQAVIDRAKALFETWQEGSPIDPNIRTVVYITAARESGNDVFEYLVDRHKKEKLAEEQRRFTAAITSVADPELIRKGLDIIRTDQVRLQDVLSWIYGFYYNRHAREMVWEWQKEHWDWIEEKFGEGHLYSNFVQGFAVFSDNERADEIEAFFADRNQVGIARSLKQALEQIRWQAAWRERHLDASTKALQALAGKVLG